jgi:hypothetical protein
VAEAILGEMGLDPALVARAVNDPTTGDEILAEHEAVLAHGGFGVPTMIFDDGQTLFGPVLVDPPEGEAAVRLWRAATAWLEFPHLYELQRPKTSQDVEAIARAFSAYLDARDWVSVERPTP